MLYPFLGYGQRTNPIFHFKMKEVVSKSDAVGSRRPKAREVTTFQSRKSTVLEIFPRRQRCKRGFKLDKFAPMASGIIKTWVTIPIVIGPGSC